MDSDLIYAKTASGEEAVQKRTRLMQRNVRMVLILVDGQSTVADLCQKTNNPKLTESALAELENNGLIELRVGQDSIWEESRQVAEEIRTAAMGRPASKIAEIAEQPPVFQPEMIDDRVFVHSDFPGPARDPSEMHISLAPLSPVGNSSIEARGGASLPSKVQGARKASEKPRGKEIPDDEIDIKAIRRGPRSPQNCGRVGVWWFRRNRRHHFSGGNVLSFRDVSAESRKRFLRDSRLASKSRNHAREFLSLSRLATR